MPLNPEQQARIEIDRLLTAAGWHVCGVKDVDLHAARGIAVREFPLKDGHGYADYLLYVDGRAAGVIEANVIVSDKKPASETPWKKKLWIYDLRTNKHFTLTTEYEELIARAIIDDLGAALEQFRLIEADLAAQPESSDVP